MTTGKKKSKFITQDSVPDDHYLDTFGGGVNRKIPKPKFFKQIRDEAQTFIYPTVVSLQQANLEADPDNPIYVRVAENDFYLYTITSLAPGPNDISLDNGATATFQQERIPDADEIPADGDDGNVQAGLNRRVVSLSDITSLASVDTSALLDGQQFRRKEFWPDTGVGGVDLYWKADEPVANHNGGTVIDPAKISELDTGTKTFGTYFDADTVSGNTGCFVSLLQNTISIPIFGAFGDGATDSSGAIQSAVNACVSSGKPLYIPRASDPYNIYDTSIYCTLGGVRDSPAASIVIRGGGNRKIQGTDVGGPVIQYTGNSFALHFGVDTDGSLGPIVTLENFALDGVGQGYGGLYLKRAGNYSTSVIEGIICKNFISVGAYLFRCYGIPIRGCVFNENATGIKFDNCNGLSISQGSVSQNSGEGMRIFYNNGIAGDGEADQGNAAAAGLIYGVLVEINGGVGVLFEGQQSALLEGCYIEGNGASSIHNAQVVVAAHDGGAGTNSKAIKITGNRFNGNPTPSNYGVLLERSDGAIVAGNQFLGHSVSSIHYSGNINEINFHYDNYTADPQMVTSDVLSEQYVGTHYTNENIVGAVSEAGGFPTGAAFESGSNSNGSFLKLADGSVIWSASRTMTADASSPTIASVFDLPTDLVSGSGKATVSINGGLGSASITNSEVSFIGVDSVGENTYQIRLVSSGASFSVGDTVDIFVTGYGKSF